MRLEVLRHWTTKLLKREITYYDYVMFLLRRIFVKMQTTYNTHLKKVNYIDRSQGKEVGVVILTGLYPITWDVVFRRVYEFSGNFDVTVLNAGGLNREKAIRLSEEFGFSYLEGTPNNYVALQNYYIMNSSHKIIIKMDDDVFLTNYTLKNLLDAYKRLREAGFDIGFVAPVLNVNNVTYYHFLKTLDLLSEYEALFEKAIFIRNWTKQAIWLDPQVARWIWERSLPLNETAEKFNYKNKEQIDVIPVRFSIQLILFEKSFLEFIGGMVSPGPKFLGDENPQETPQNNIKLPRLLVPFGDEESMNFFADIYMAGRFIALDSFAGHLAYAPQRFYMIEWFKNNKEKFVEDIRK
ncbi:hypothetical protein PAE0545 [Pyrobaculum aerophilum str. IM2]|uniref:Uncharacterized protein n=2 Tax=Pyrobaculum aerophilum TaxID=13773 RepID=Q8ZYY7_PYRAE|nr:hypothetical protein [Pyrobaculum aerophilum]AAL62854.1 hypothetical protein PAE0545 [Pyrobaculum aerophilum str. IM2]HII46279.1 hypothetical protein [Pyrobaculum aerophilum]